ncbi:GNAT family N-acetyltransferase [Nocardiopsis sp. NPDC006832]|uniref:GNAT family N-acetyltransferase n=1 Tax=Nocardiopsis sp. NPDC006832 TaxID=3157188 RepID=UPI0033FA949F
MTIRSGEAEDAAAIADVHIRSWRAAYRGIVPDDALASLDHERLTRVWADRLTGEFTGPGAGVLVAERDDAVVAFAGFAPGDDPEWPEGGERRVVDLGTFYSVPEVWGSGANQGLAEAVHSAMARGPFDEAVLWVLSANPRARRFYEAQGWQDTGVEIEEELLGGTIMCPVSLYRRSIGRLPG